MAPAPIPRGIGLLAALLVVLAPAAVAGESDPEPGRLALEATLEPADLAPGGDGWLVVTGRLGAGWHIYAGGDGATAWAPVETPGVTYHLGTAKTSPTLRWTPSWGDESDARDVWEESFTLRIKVSVAKDAAPDAPVGVLVTYNPCNEKLCLQTVKDQPAVVRLSVPAKPPRLSPPLGNVGGEVRLEVRDLSADGRKGIAVVTFAPAFGFHFYLPTPEVVAEGLLPITAEPVAAHAVTWGAFEIPKDRKELTEELAVRIPFERFPEVERIGVKVSFQACSTRCLDPEGPTLLEAVFETGAAAAPPEPAGQAVPETPVVHELLLPVVGEKQDVGADADEGGIAGNFRRNGILAFGLIFLFGLGLAFTPCVLPLIPITISVIGGGRDVPKARLTGLLGTYVLGLGLTYGGMGVAAAFAGGSMSDAFREPLVIWGIALFFLFLGAAMLGVFELQPPQWIMRLQGGAQRRSGSFIGAFMFGCLAAIIASPCTGPFVAALVVFAAEQKDPVFGFAMFFVLALGMGAVFFAAGTLNFLMRPGPWMVWVRYMFGLILFVMALYYLGNQWLIVPPVSYAVAAALGLLGAALVAWHLMRKEGAPPREAVPRAAVLAVLLVAFGCGTAWFTRPIEGVQWTKVRDREHLLQEVHEATAQGRPVIVDVWATWCGNCKAYDKVMVGSKDLLDRLDQMVRLKIDVTHEQFADLRAGLGVDPDTAPALVFIDRKGRIRQDAVIQDWLKEEAEAGLKRSLDLVLGGS
jgi:thiol:disulfide interchange protein